MLDFEKKVLEIEEAQRRLEKVVLRTPLQKHENLSKKHQCNVYFKREDLQVVRSFKIRGAYNKIASLDRTIVDKGIVCASAGNHAQGFAFACAALKVKGYVFMPATTPRQKVSKVRFFGENYVEIILTGDTYDDAYEASISFCNEKGLTFIHAFDDAQIIAGQGTVGAEILQDADFSIDYVLVAVGGGGLISGVGAYFKAKSPNTKIVGIEATGAPALHQALANNVVVKLDDIDNFADGIAVKRVGDHTFPICQQVIDQLLLIDEGHLCTTLLQLYNDDAIVVEPAGAIVVSALDRLPELNGKNVVVIICGGNNDINRMHEISDRSLLWQGLKHYFIIKFPQRAGALREFLQLLGKDDDITHFQYTKKNHKESGPALVGVELKNRDDFDQLIQNFNQHHIHFQHLNNNPLLFDMLV